MGTLLVAATKILAVKADTSIGPTHLPSQPTCLTRPNCDIGLPAQFMPAQFMPAQFMPAASALVEVDFLQAKMP
jgi:hypothetical protein